MPHPFKSAIGFGGNHFAFHQLMTCPSKFGSHLQPQFQRPRTEAFLAAYLQITGLAVIAHIIGIFGLTVGKIVLPVVISHHAIGYMTLEMEPAAEDGQCPILGQSQTRLRHGTGIDAQRL